MVRETHTMKQEPSKLPPQQQTPPGVTSQMRPVPDHGEDSYVGSGKLQGKVAIITGGDSGIGRAVVIAFAREGADIVLSYLSEDQDADSSAELVRQAGRRVLTIRGDITEERRCYKLVDQAMAEFGRLDILVNNAAFQRTHKSLDDIPLEEWEMTLRTNVTASFMLAKAAVKHMRPGASIINTTSIQSRDPSGSLLAYATSKGAISNFTAGCTGPCRQGYPRERGCARTDLDASHPVNHATRQSGELWEEHSAGSRGTARRIGGSLRAARLRRRELHDRSRHPGDRRRDNDLIVQVW